MCKLHDSIQQFKITNKLIHGFIIFWNMVKKPFMLIHNSIEKNNKDYKLQHT